MIIEIHPSFKKAYKKRISSNKKMVDKVSSRIELFQKNPSNPALHDHQLTGRKKMLRSFWITGDTRIVYQPVSKDCAIFLDIGTHNQVY